ncbi:ParA family protein [Altericroceibacterium spongiae]|uniref:ParA family protein n=1 Tax=Altericroceibacterium spongiae TaxID=2320269 RepID=A0A420EAP4_9SPHN|nr:ParA family protein [Altericroceibacterium spongiae]RKF17741.1 ParA family protein [Altericroceibacterium spongiae]
MAVISIANPKGGAGKTTLALVLADEFARNGASVAVIDADPNAVIAKWAHRRDGEGKNTRFQIIPRPDEAKMISTIDQLSETTDIIIIDLEGTASRMTSRALLRSHLVLIPFNQSPIDAELAANAVALVAEESEAVQRDIPFRLIRSRDNAAIATKSSQRILSAIKEADMPMLNVGLVERAAYRDMFDFNATLDELDSSTTSGIEKAMDNAKAVASAVLDAFKEVN